MLSKKTKYKFITTNRVFEVGISVAFMDKVLFFVSFFKCIHFHFKCHEKLQSLILSQIFTSFYSCHTPILNYTLERKNVPGK